METLWTQVLCLFTCTSIAENCKKQKDFKTIVVIHCSVSTKIVRRSLFSKHRCNFISCLCLVPNKQRRCELIKCNDAMATYFIILGNPHQLVSTASDLGFCLFPPFLWSSTSTAKISVCVGFYTSLSHTSRECPVFYLWYPQTFLEVYHPLHKIHVCTI